MQYVLCIRILGCVQFSLGSGYAGFAPTSQAFQRRRSKSFVLSVAEPNTQWEGGIEFQSLWLGLRSDPRLRRTDLLFGVVAVEAGQELLDRAFIAIHHPLVDIPWCPIELNPCHNGQPLLDARQGQKCRYQQTEARS